MTENKPLISIIIPCRNEEKFIKNCLNSIIQQDYPQNKMEILIIDGMSEDNTRNIIKQYTNKFQFIKRLDNPKKITPVAFNIGIRNANGDFIIIMGSHTNYKKNYISKCIETSIKYNADNIGGIHKIIPRTNTLIAKAITFCFSSIFGVGDSYYKRGYSKGIKEVDTVFGGCYKKEIFNKIGFFNENLVRSQDMEFNMRLKKSGGKILLAPDIISYYYPNSTLISFFLHNIKDGIWAIYPLKFVKTPLKLRHYIPLFFILSLLISLILSIFFILFLWSFLFILILYLIVNLYFSAKIAYNKKELSYLFVTPFAFICRHFGYGIGSLIGLFKLIL